MNRWMVPALLLIAAWPQALAGQQPRDPLGLGTGPGQATLQVPAVEGREEIQQALDAGDWEHAERLLAAAAESNPSSREILAFLAGVFLADRKPLNAAIALKKAEALGPLEDPLRYALAIAYISLGRGDWARPELEKLAKADPSDTSYQYWLARLDYDDGYYAAAIERLEAVIARDPAFMRAYDNLGLSYEAQGHPEKAIASYREAIRLNREAGVKSPWPPLNLGILLRSRNELEEAERLFRESIAHDPAFAQAHYQLGALLEQTGRVDEALRSLRRAAELDASYPQPHYALARIYRRQGRVEEAREALAVFKRLSDAAGERVQ